jgi:hypothetical protein
MKRFSWFCLVFALLPFLVLAIAMGLLKILGCDSNLGPAITHCTHATSSIGDALKGLLWLGGFGWILTIPAALVDCNV